MALMMDIGDLLRIDMKVLVQSRYNDIMGEALFMKVLRFDRNSLVF